MKSLRICFASLIALLLLASCAPVIDQPISTPQDTATAIHTVTVVPGPIGTATLTVTPIPPPTRRPTSIASPSLTPATAIPSLASLTRVPTSKTRTTTPTITGTSTRFVIPPPGGKTWTPDLDSYKDSYRCAAETSYPKYGFITVKPRTDVVVQWKLTNPGPNMWHVNDIVYGYVSGEKMQNADRGNTTLSFTVYKGDKIYIQVHLKSPKEPGIYITTWGMWKTNKTEPFCLFDVTIEVVKR
jgi:hypothetical protein